MNFMNSSTTNASGPRRLPVRWVDEPAVWSLLLWQRGGGANWVVARWAAAGPRGSCKVRGFRPFRRTRAFTLLELMMVVAIISFVAVMALPHVSGYSKANTMATADRQLLDDIRLARQRALVNRSTVYMVFVPPSFWTNQVFLNTMQTDTLAGAKLQLTNLLQRQYTSYALLSLNSVGDQPGQHFAHYLTDWKTLPQGVFISEFEFNSNQPVITI